MTVGWGGGDPTVVGLHLQARSSGAWKGGDEVDVAVLSGPDVFVAGRQVHGRIVEGPGQRRPVTQHGVEEALVDPQTDGQDPQHPALQVQRDAVELHQHLGGAR